MYISKKINFNKLNKFYKRLGITFNDFIMCIIGKNYKKYCQELEVKHNTKYELDTFTTWSAVSLRAMPKELKDFVIDNEVTGMTIEIPTIDSVEKECKKVSSVIGKLLKNPFELYGAQLASIIIKLVQNLS